MKVSTLLKEKIPYSFKCKVLYDVSMGMQFLHQNEIVHRDLKPDNILVASIHEDSRYPNAKISDFDTARSFISFAEHPYESVILKKDSEPAEPQKKKKNLSAYQGTVSFMAPEMMDGTARHPGPCDVFSFGTLMWQTITNQQPFGEFKKEKDITDFIKGKNRLPIPASVDQDFRDLIEHCWKHDPLERPNFIDIGILLKKKYEKVQTENPNRDELDSKIEGWFGNIAREEAIKKLKASPEGSFLIRFKENEVYVLSYNHKNDLEKEAMQYITNLSKNISEK